MTGRQPKTVEEFMALPEHEPYTAVLVEVRDGVDVYAPRMTVGYCFYHEPDTVFLCGGWMLTLTDKGFARRRI